jgi:hypothetical protein
MEAGTRLSPGELAALGPGDAVTIESGADFGRTRRTAGIVTRVTDTKAFVRVQSARGVPYVQEFSLRTGWRTGRGNYAALVHPDAGQDRSVDDQRRDLARINMLWRAWSRNPGDVEALRELHEMLGQRLGLVRS